ncbi:unnamed protein product [Arctia plantaginis]|uniref:Uncharacterized protein n=1 Tax=Arctia plantaginis TaxID=874455 RepID=A0A8S1B5B6_ARCPL|nr:unnamed protein product [Arctia plantaginis]
MLWLICSKQHWNECHRIRTNLSEERIVPQQVNICEDSMHPPLTTDLMLLQLLLAIQLNRETLSFSEEAISCIV